MKNKAVLNQFKVYCNSNINEKVTKDYVTELVEKDEPLILEGVASTNSVDLDGDYMTNDCLEDMKKQAKGLSIFLDHDHTIDKIVGTVTDVLETNSDEFRIKFSVLPSFEWEILELLENGVNLGLSIGATVEDFEQTETGWAISKVKLVEISIVGIPANWDTYGTVQRSKSLGNDFVTAKCINGACKMIVDKLNVSKDTEDGEDPDDDGVISYQEVVDLINEMGIQLKNEIISEIVFEFNLDGRKYETSGDDGAVADDNNSSSQGEKENEVDMEKDELIELIKENTLDFDAVKSLIVDTIKGLEEADAPVVEEGIAASDVEGEDDMVKTAEEEAVEEEAVEEVDAEDKSEAEEKVETEEEIEEVDTEDEAEEEDEAETEEKAVEKKSESVETVKTLSESDIEELKKSIRAEIEKEILDSLSEVEPVAHEQPSVEDLSKDAEADVEKSNVLSPRAMAEKLLQL